jgi:hypothetical protein
MKTWLNRILDLALWVAFALLLATGLVLRCRLPPGSRGGSGLSIWGWSRHDWGDLHLWLAYVTCVLVLLHLALHWRWLWQILRSRWRWPVLVSLLVGIALVAGVWLLPVEHVGGGEHASELRGQGQGRGWRGGRLPIGTE